jgi:hypothetical protein
MPAGVGQSIRCVQPSWHLCILIQPRFFRTFLLSLGVDRRFESILELFGAGSHSARTRGHVPSRAHPAPGPIACTGQSSG